MLPQVAQNNQQELATTHANLEDAKRYKTKLEQEIQTKKAVFRWEGVPRSQSHLLLFEQRHG